MPASDRDDSPDAGALLRAALASGRLHASFLLSGAGERPREAALEFARAVVCRGDGARPCGGCRDCQLSAEGDDAPEGREPPAIDGTGKRGPLLRHIGDHPDLYWVDRGEDGTRVRIGQVRALQSALRLAANEGGWRAAVIADAEWLNIEAQNALLHLLEEPPAATCLVLVTRSPAGLLATIRSRCQRAAFDQSTRPILRGAEASEDVRALAQRFDALADQSVADLLDWAEEYRGARAIVVPRVQTLIASGSEWLREDIAGAVSRPGAGSEPRVRAKLDAFRALAACRRDLAQRNANPQMVAERTLLAMRQAVGGAR
jgi:DNA polymerase-3 subunit delta'